MTNEPADCLNTSMPMVPCPAMTCGSSNGWMMVMLSVFESFKACAAVSSKVSPMITTVAPSLLTELTLMAGVVTGMQMTALHLSFFAASATPWAWFPALAQTTPLSSSS